MKIRLIAFIIFLGFYTSAQAQTNNFSVGAELNFPSGNSSNISVMGLGAYLKGEIAVAEKFGLTASAAVNNFFGRKLFNQVNSKNINFLPVKGGVKYYPSEDFYVEGMAGVSFSLNDSDKSSFIWSPGMGTYIKAGASKLDIGIRYESQKNVNQLVTINGRVSNFNYVGIRIGYVL